ncbi:MAG: glycosyltransferase [Nocardioidaceae bacterium]
MGRKARIKVLWCIKCLGYGGAERLLVSAAHARDADRFEYEAAYVLPSKHALVPELEAGGVAVHCIGSGESNFDLRWMARLRRLLMAGRFDVVHFHLPYTAGLGRLVVQSMPAAVRPMTVTTEHNVWSTNPWPVRAVNTLTTGFDDARLAVSPAVKDALPARHRQRAEIVMPGVFSSTPGQAAAWRGHARAELGVAPHEVLVGTVANLRPGKGYDVLLPAARALLDRRLPVRFVAIGVGPLEDEVAALHARLGLGRSFQLLGGRSDVLRVIAGFDLFALPSRSEGRPVAVMEALSLGVPVVASGVPGITDVVAHRRNGLLVTPGSADLLAEALARLVNDPAERARMSERARHSGRRFDILPAVRRTEAVYEELAASRGCVDSALDGGWLPSPLLDASSQNRAGT